MTRSSCNSLHIVRHNDNHARRMTVRLFGILFISLLASEFHVSSAFVPDNLGASTCPVQHSRANKRFDQLHQPVNISHVTFPNHSSTWSFSSASLHAVTKKSEMDEEGQPTKLTKTTARKKSSTSTTAKKVKSKTDTEFEFSGQEVDEDGNNGLENKSSSGEAVVNFKKPEFVTALSQKTGMTKTESEVALSAVLNVIASEVSTGKRISLPGFGTFKLSYRSARKGRNPKTGEEIDIGPSYCPSFTASRSFKEMVNMDK